MKIEMLNRIIQELEDKNNILTENNLLLKDKLKQENLRLENPNTNKRNKSSKDLFHSPKNVKQTNPKLDEDKGKTESKKISEQDNKNICVKDLSSAVLEAKTAAKLKEIINLEKENKEWTEVRRRKQGSNKNVTITGTLESNNDALKAVTIQKKVWIHATKFRQETKADDVITWLQQLHNREDFICEKIKPKYPNPKYASFKIGADMSLKDDLYNPNSWFKGVEISRYNFFRERANALEFF